MERSRDDFVIAIRSAFLKKGTQQRFSLLSLILFSIIFLVLGSFNFKIIEFNKILIKEIVYRSSFVVSGPEKIIKNTFNKIIDHFEYYDDYQLVKEKLQKFNNTKLSKKIITYENIELKKLIEDYFIQDNQVYAKVLSDKESPFLKSIIINKGSKNKIKIGMIAQDKNYLIGRVVEVNFLTSRVLLISDINSKVPITIRPINIEAIMTGFERRKGKLQYIKDERLINQNDKELIAVTSGSGGLFKSGIPIGTISLSEIYDNNEIIVNFYRDFSQLKYVKVLSFKKEVTQFDQANQILLKKNEMNNTSLNSQKRDNKVLQQQNLISKEIRNKLEEENLKLKSKIIDTQNQLNEKIKKISKDNTKDIDIKFLQLNLLYGHKCRRSFLKAHLYKIKSPEYRICVLNAGVIKKN